MDATAAARPGPGAGTMGRWWEAMGATGGAVVALAMYWVPMLGVVLLYSGAAAPRDAPLSDIGTAQAGTSLTATASGGMRSMKWRAKPWITWAPCQSVMRSIHMTRPPVESPPRQL